MNLNHFIRRDRYGRNMAYWTDRKTSNMLDDKRCANELELEKTKEREISAGIYNGNDDDMAPKERDKKDVWKKVLKIYNDCGRWDVVLKRNNAMRYTSLSGGYAGEDSKQRLIKNIQDRYKKSGGVQIEQIEQSDEGEY